MDLGSLLDGVHQAEGNIKVGTGAEQTVMGPDCCIELLHFFAGSHGDLGAAGNHPLHNAHTVREHNGTLSGCLPQSPGESLCGQGQNIGHSNDIGRMRMINNTALAVSCLDPYRMVHEVAGELAGGLCAAFQAPDDPPGITLIIDLDNADGMLGIQDHITEELAGTGGQEVLACQVFAGDAHADPGAGFLKERHACFNFLRLHAVGQITAIALMPALKPAIVAHTDIVLNDLNI